jgi:hypothetical protein
MNVQIKKSGSVAEADAYQGLPSSEFLAARNTIYEALLTNVSKFGNIQTITL